MYDPLVSGSGGDRVILILLPRADYEPSEAAVPWWALRAAGFDLQFATPDGAPAFAIPEERGPTRSFLTVWAELTNGRTELARYREMTADPAFRAPLAYDAVDPAALQGLVIPGGAAGELQKLAETPAAQEIARSVFAAGKPVGAICHGVLLLAHTTDPATGRSLLHGRRTTALPAWMDWFTSATTFWAGHRYAGYTRTVQTQVTAALASPRDFVTGPRLPRRAKADAPERGFAVRDGAYVSARWPGDCHRFAAELVEVMRTYVPSPPAAVLLTTA